MTDAGETTQRIDTIAEETQWLTSKLLREIASKQQERLAMSFAAGTMLMLGTITALRHRDSLPLVVYLWSFFPALAMVLLISSGQQYAHSESVPAGVAGGRVLSKYSGDTYGPNETRLRLLDGVSWSSRVLLNTSTLRKGGNH